MHGRRQTNVHGKLRRVKLFYCEQLVRNCSTVYYFSHTIQIFSGEISFQSRHQSNLYHLLEGLTRVFCNISYDFRDIPFQARKTDILEVICFYFFLTTTTIIQKSSHQSLGSICVVSILERQVLQIHTTSCGKNLNCISYLLYLCAHVRYDHTNSCSTDLFHRLYIERHSIISCSYACIIVTSRKHFCKVVNNTPSQYPITLKQIIITLFLSNT